MGHSDNPGDVFYAGIAAAAAFTATIGDFLMLSVAHGTVWVLDQYDLTLAVVWVGGSLGAFFIPLYFLGYRQASSLLDWTKSRHRAAVVIAGGGVAMFGAITHALTAADIHIALASGSAVRQPIEAFAPALSPLFIAATLATACACVASAAFLWTAWKHPAPRLRLPTALNPIFVAVLLIATSSASTLLGNYLAPTAANLAHVAFFLACARAVAIRNRGAS